MIMCKEIKLKKQIGKGGCGKVYLGEYNFAEVAVKEIELLSENDIEEALATEVTLMKNLRHPNLITYYGHFIHKGNVRVVMDYCKGGSLFDLLRNEKLFLSVKQKLKILFDSAAGLYHLHSQTTPILHRDIKSLNVLIVEEVKDNNNLNLTAKLTDYGLAIQFFENPKSKTVMSSEIGTIQWMAPEVLRDEEYGVMSDVYSFAILLWETFTHKIPYSDIKDNDEIIKNKVASNEIRPTLELLSYETPDEIINLMMLCWEHDASKRPTMKEVAGFLKNLMEQYSQN